MQGDISRNIKNELLQFIMERKTRGKGHQEHDKFLAGRTWSGMNTRALIKAEEPKEELALVIANLR